VLLVVAAAEISTTTMTKMVKTMEMISVLD